MNTMTPHPLTLEDFYRLPPGAMVTKTWAWGGDNAEPEIWQRLRRSNYWVELTDFNARYEYAPNAAYSEGARHVVLWKPTPTEDEAQG